jgi:hypothetical protein
MTLSHSRTIPILGIEFTVTDPVNNRITFAESDR